VFFSADLRADEAKKILDPREMFRVIILYVQQINMFLHFLISKLYRKDLFLFDVIHVNGDVVEIFKLFSLIKFGNSMSLEI